MKILGKSLKIMSKSFQNSCFEQHFNPKTSTKRPPASLSLFKLSCAKTKALPFCRTAAKTTSRPETALLWINIYAISV